LGGSCSRGTAACCCTPQIWEMYVW
jgi:hypothetical protein